MTSQASRNAAVSVLDLFLPPVRAWFLERFEAPTPAQQQGWPSIAAGVHTLIVAPTGSGKTLAAFLACLDLLWREPADRETGAGAGVLYISPLKALNVDIATNLHAPLAEIQATAQRLGSPLRPLRVGVRTGDTPPSERARQRRRPPDVFITTPESLHLLLTSGAREALRSVRFVIVDEIHALCGNKRGVFLSLLLERLEAICPAGFVRVGLSATQRPLDEVARFLGGRRHTSGQGTSARFEPRPVHIVDAGHRKDLDLEVIYRAGYAPAGTSIWPAIEERVLELIRAHRSTIVFANNRRVVERLAASLNERAVGDEPAGTDDANPTPLVRPHHGSLSMETRRATEELLKRGELRGVVATASLEMGIDMGAVELVCQVGSPGGVARGLQRVGRAGHLVGKVSRGRIFAKTCADLLESAAVARAMSSGDVERLKVPTNCLDVLAQQIVAHVAGGRVDALALYDLVRQSYAYRDLSAEAFEGVLRMVSGRYGVETFRDLKPRVSWDRLHHVLTPLPGTAQLALVGGGAIPDTGQYPLYLGSDGPRLGELDEEFVLEQRVGQTFRLGQGTWRIEAIEPHRVVVSPAAGEAAIMPFWRGEGVGRTLELGEAVASLTREVADLGTSPHARDWLRTHCFLDEAGADALVRYVARQLNVAGAVPDERTVLVESFADPAGELGMAILCPLGKRVNHALKLAIQGWMRRRFGLEVAALHGDDGVLIRLPGSDEPPLGLLDALTPDLAEELIRDELGTSALFGLRFRQNACRALLMPRPDPSKRTPLWLQRLRARDLLQVVRGFPDFPIVIETYRECLDDDLELPRLRAWLGGVQRGDLRVVKRAGAVASPFASELIFQFTRQYLYEWDEPKGAAGPRPSRPDDALIDAVLKGRDEGFGIPLDPNAVERVAGRLRGSRLPRTLDEMAEHVRRMGDLANSELQGPMAGFLDALSAEGRVQRVQIPRSDQPERWVASEDLDRYRLAFECAADAHDAACRDARRAIVRAYLHTRPLVGVADVVRRYGLDVAEATDLLEVLTEAGDLALVDDASEKGPRWAERRNLVEMRRLTLAIRRNESVAIQPEAYVDFVLERQRVLRPHRVQGSGGLDAILGLLEGFAAPVDVWEEQILPRRVLDFRASWLDERVRFGDWTWLASAGGRGDVLVRFLREEMVWGREPGEDCDQAARQVREFLRGRGSCHVVEIARATGLLPSGVQQALRLLMQKGQVTADSLEPVRKFGGPMFEVLEQARAARASDRHTAIWRLGRRRGPPSRKPQPRWRAWGSEASDHAADESAALVWSEWLLDRYGVLCRDTAALEPGAPPWRVLAPVLSQAELRGDIRRGYFVEGLSGLQYALDETVGALARAGSRVASQADSEPTLIGSIDPANLYGAGAPFDIPLLEGGTARLVRSPGTSLVIRAGRPILIIEGHGKRLTGLASASEEDLRAALAHVRTLATASSRVVKVETYNQAPVLASPVAPWLADLGFVRNPPGLAYYAGW